jgi:Fur family peroxide stress response transcriptional regulator
MILVLCAYFSISRPVIPMRPDTQDQPANLAERLAHSGLRNTTQREVIYRALHERRDHPTADEVFARVRVDLPTISLATVYNCLETLVQCQLVRQVNFEREPTRYCPNLKPHAHFHDQASGSTLDIDLPPDLLAQVKAILPPSYQAETVEITFHGRTTTEPVTRTK